MALLDFLKRKKEVEKGKEKQPEKKAEKVSVVKESKKIEAAPVKNSGLAKKGFSYTVVKAPHISEKATYLAEDNKYTFTVYSGANKPEVKKSVEGIYGVNVISVNMIKIPHKARRIGKTQGFKKGYTKAIVTVKKGQKIEIF